MIEKVLIANRGEIALRVIKTCKALGIKTVAVYSDEDYNSLHVKQATEAYHIGEASPAKSYLNQEKILETILSSGADAIHPGYGFLSENFEFAKMCEQWNLTFIGPNPGCIEKMGDKIYSKKIAKEANVPTLDPIYIKELSDQDILKAAKKMTYPVLIKASAGGGGRGMKRIDQEADLLSTISLLKQEAKAAFGDDTLFIEKFITNPRHIEVQILADEHGNMVHVGERDCTIQRRFQKILEEAPSPVLSNKKRQEICGAAVRLAKSVNYDSVGTVEFLYDLDSEQFYFMEMNTRIQVEHPVTEQYSGIDLIAEQIRHAQGEKLRYSQDKMKFSGHVIECRINAEDPVNSMPSPGTITHYHRPGGPGVRVDDYIYTGYKVSPHYDSMISKIIVSADTREQCVTRALRALDETVVGGIKTNIELHRLILQDSDFRQNTYNTNFLAHLMLK